MSASTGSEDFASLLARVNEGDEHALVVLLERYAGTIKRTVRGLLGNLMRPHLDTVDVVQSLHRTLLVGVRNNEFDISEPAKLIALAGTLIRRKVARHWRHLQKQPGTRVPDSAARVASVPDHHGADPAATALFNEEVKSILDSLDGVDRRLLELRLQGHSTAQAARELGLDAPFLRVRLGRLRKRLRDQGLLDDLP